MTRSAMIATACVALGLATPSLYATSTPDDTTAPADASVLERFAHPTTPRLVTYRALRRMKATAMGGRFTAELEAWTTLDAQGHFTYEVVREAGSELIRARVLREALDTERDNYEPDNIGRMELVPANYEFRSRGLSGPDQADIALLPRRTTPLLLRGIATIHTRTGDVLRVEGSPAEMPSWWTRQVDIVQRYDRVLGVQVPVEISSTANVRIAGPSTFQMLYQYASVNGHRVEDGSY